MLNDGSSLISANIWMSRRVKVNGRRARIRSLGVAHQVEDVTALSRVGKFDGETLGHAAENGRVDIIGSVGCAENEDASVVVGRQSVPKAAKV